MLYTFRVEERAAQNLTINILHLFHFTSELAEAIYCEGPLIVP